MTSLISIEFSTGPGLTTRGRDLLLPRTVRFCLMHVVPHHISAVIFASTTDAVRSLEHDHPFVPMVRTHLLALASGWLR